MLYHIGKPKNTLYTSLFFFFLFFFLFFFFFSFSIFSTILPAFLPHCTQSNFLTSRAVSSFRNSAAAASSFLAINHYLPIHSTLKIFSKNSLLLYYLFFEPSVLSTLRRCKPLSRAMISAKEGRACGFLLQQSLIISATSGSTVGGMSRCRS